MSGIHTSLFTLLPVMLPSYISPEDATESQLNHVRLTSDCWHVVDVYVSLCLLEWRMRQRDSNCAAKTESGVARSLSSVLPLFH